MQLKDDVSRLARNAGQIVSSDSVFLSLDDTACFYTQIHINSFGTVFFWCSGSDCGCFGKTAHLGRAFSVALEDPVVAALRRRVLDFVAFSF